MLVKSTGQCSSITEELSYITDKMIYTFFVSKDR